MVVLQFSQKRFTINRQFKDIQQLHDDLISSMFVETGNMVDDVSYDFTVLTVTWSFQLDNAGYVFVLLYQLK